MRNLLWTFREHISLFWHKKATLQKVTYLLESGMLSDSAHVICLFQKRKVTTSWSKLLCIFYNNFTPLCASSVHLLYARCLCFYGSVVVSIEILFISVFDKGIYEPNFRIFLILKLSKDRISGTILKLTIKIPDIRHNPKTKFKKAGYPVQS